MDSSVHCCDRGAVQGKHLAIGLLGALGLAVGLIFWMGATGGGRASEGGREMSASAAAPQTSNDASPNVTTHGPWPIRQTKEDRQLRDELRRRIVERWAEGGGEAAQAAKAERFPPMPIADDDALDRAYTKSIVQDDLLPRAMRCYQELVAREPDAAGRIEVSFKIMGDDELGGIVEQVDLDGKLASPLGDAAMQTCIRESLLRLSFRPPPKDGWATVVYPMEFGQREAD
ncbi:MAG TPA: AgmX/PglI C-terminal domain-containing protein [Labilithrix sp.]|nr:AgmX/PglI C-terminal domain-containing protein [Labilithrix sp.]